MPDFEATTFAIITGFIVALAAALIGVVLVLRRNSMIADGLSHVGVGALAVASVLNLAPLPVALPVVIIASIFILRLSANHKIHGDSAIALCATSALALGALLTAGEEEEEFEHFLFGDIFSVSLGDVALALALGAAIIAIFALNYRKIFAVTFDEGFAKASGINTERYNLLFAVLASVTVVLGMRLVGSLLISSLTIFPVLISESLFKTFKSVLISSAVVSVLNFLLGFLIAGIFGLSVGATVVLVSLAVLVVVKLISGSKLLRRL